MTIEREAPPAPEVRIKQLSERCAKLENLLEAALLLTKDAIQNSRSQRADLVMWRMKVAQTLPVEKVLTSNQKLQLTELCQSIGINAFMCEKHIMVASTVDGPALEKLAIALHTNPLSLSFGE